MIHTTDGDKTLSLTTEEDRSITNLSADADKETLVSAVTELADAVTELAEDNEQLRAEVADLRDDERDADLEDDSDEEESDEDLRDDLRDEQQTRAKEDAAIRQRVTNVEERLDDVEEGGLPDADPTPDRQQSMALTPIERLADGNEEDVSQHVTPSIERAVTLFEHIRDWARKTPKGYTLRPADSPKTLLEAARGESLAWQQYYRAAETLEQLTKGAVTFFDHDRHGKTIVLHEHSEVHSRVTSETDHSQPSLAAD
jgi:hypothetical protein